MIGDRLAPRRLAILKPEFGVTGGFEGVVDRVEATLRRDGHDVTRLTVAVDELSHDPFGLSVPDQAWREVPEYFRYLASIEAFQRLDTRSFDAVISTQPPSFANQHPRHLALFFHHHRIFYDLEQPFLAAGLSEHPDLHRQAATLVRELDRPLLGGVGWFLAGSEAVRTRLARFNQLDNVGLFHAGIESVRPPDSTQDPGGVATGMGAVLCIGRHEFPKRVELFVQAMKHLPDRPGLSVGTGGREEWAKDLDRQLSRPGADLEGLSDEQLWCNTGRVVEPGPPPTTNWKSNIEFLGRVEDKTRDRLYAEAPCVVAPALDEDYGLTALEAMSHGTPVVVCADGGGLATIVEHEVDGLIVEPTGTAIATAVEQICSDPALRSQLAAGGRAKAARTTWPRADDQLRAGLSIVLS